jgi:hypothetical protein
MKAMVAEGAGGREQRLRRYKRGQAWQRRWWQCGGGNGNAVIVFLSQGKIKNSFSAETLEKNCVF